MAPRPNSHLAAALAGVLAFAPASEALAAGTPGFGTLAAGPTCAAAFPGNGGNNHGGHGSTININKNVTIFKPVTINNNIDNSKTINVYKPVTINNNVSVTKTIDNSKHIDVTKNIDLSKTINIDKSVVVNKNIDNSKT